MTYNNPFIAAARREVVESTNFIGREHNLQRIAEKVILPPEHQRASIAIIGLPDIGKNCLVNKALLDHKAELHQQKLLPIEMDLKNYVDADEHDNFFRDLMLLCKYEMEEEDIELLLTKTSPSLSKTLQDILHEPDTANVISISLLKRFFNKLLRIGIRVIFILNNFDAADSLFREHTDRIHWLRDLTGSKCQVTWIALACKPIREIKRIPKSISDDFFDVHYLGMFSQDDVQTYFHMLIQAGVNLTQAHEKTITAFCGHHPYLLSLLGSYLIENYAHQPDMIDVERTFHNVEERFHRSYERIIDLVLTNDGDDEKLQKLWQVISGGAIEQKDIDRLLAYGLISPNPLWSPEQKHVQPAYVAFSEHFQTYLHTRLTSHRSLSIPEEPEQVSHVEDLYSWSQTMHPGDVLWQRYQVLAKLGTTSYNQVVKARDTRIGRIVALKRLYLDPSSSENQIRLFKDGLEREAMILGSIKHENIGLVYDIEEDPPTMIMEWIEGQTLDQYWKENDLSSIEIIRLGIKLAKALEYIHKKEQPVIHRDIKPDNIIIRENGEPVLIDFNVAQAFGAQTIVPYDENGHALVQVGNRFYSAPEQFANAQRVTDRADIYALGGVLYSTLTRGDKPSQLPHWHVPAHPKIPAPLLPILRRMLSKDPHERPDAQQLCQELERCLHELEDA